jgi:hypothetical protein
MSKVENIVKDLSILAISKIAAEQIGMRVSFIGNGTLRSGLVKGLIGVGCIMSGSRTLKFGGTGLLLDGLEDTFQTGVNKAIGTTTEEEEF